MDRQTCVFWRLPHNRIGKSESEIFATPTLTFLVFKGPLLQRLTAQDQGFKMATHNSHFEVALTNGQNLVLAEVGSVS